MKHLHGESDPKKALAMILYNNAGYILELENTRDKLVLDHQHKQMTFNERQACYNRLNQIKKELNKAYKDQEIAQAQFDALPKP